MRKSIFCLALFMSATCGQPSPKYFGYTTQVYVDAPELDYNEVEKGLRFWDAYGYNFVMSNNNKAPIVIHTMNKLFASLNPKIYGLSYWWLGRIEVRPGIPITKEVVTHELGHELGIHNHVDSLFSSCNLMNERICSRNDLGEEDLKLLAKVR